MRERLDTSVSGTHRCVRSTSSSQRVSQRMLHSSAGPSNVHRARLHARTHARTNGSVVNLETVMRLDKDQMAALERSQGTLDNALRHARACPHLHTPVRT